MRQRNTRVKTRSLRDVPPELRHLSVKSSQGKLGFISGEELLVDTQRVQRVDRIWKPGPVEPFQIWLTNGWKKVDAFKEKDHESMQVGVLSLPSVCSGQCDCD